VNDADNPIAPGDVVSGLESSELVEIQRIAPFGGKILVEGVGLQSRRMVKRPLAREELAGLVKVRGREHTFDGDARLFLLGAEAERIRIAHQFDPLFAVNSSIVDPLPHQVEAVYRYLLPLPRIRFLLADDTGAGKTIMTGLLIKELLFRGVLQKVLIITPGGLTKQWKEEELQEKFGLYARLVNRASFEAEPGQFSRYDDIFITSIDFLARNEGCLKAASETQWDLVVVDEAHKLSAYEYGTKLEESERYKAVKALARKTDHLLSSRRLRTEEERTHSAAYSCSSTRTSSRRMSMSPTAFASRQRRTGHPVRRTSKTSARSARRGTDSSSVA
jgi:hypothetical protein